MMAEMQKMGLGQDENAQPDTEDMKRRLGVKDNRPLADYA